MSIGPRGPLLKNDGPACRVCGCTEHNACVEMVTLQLTAKQKRERWSSGALVACLWVKTEGATPPLCSACSGTDADLAEVTLRMLRYMRQHGEAAHKLTVAAGLAALQRYRARLKLST